MRKDNNCRLIHSVIYIIYYNKIYYLNRKPDKVNSEEEKTIKDNLRFNSILYKM